MPPGQYVTPGLPGALGRADAAHAARGVELRRSAAQVDEPMSWTWERVHGAAERAHHGRHPLRDEVVEARHDVDGRLARHAARAASTRAPSTCSRSATAATRRTCRSRTSAAARRGSRTSTTASRSTPSTAARRGCSSRTSTSGRARSGCAGSSSARTTRPGSGRATATTTTATRGKNSGTHGD